jgi:hypothetical protein
MNNNRHDYYFGHCCLDFSECSVFETGSVSIMGIGNESHVYQTIHPPPAPATCFA